MARQTKVNPEGTLLGFGPMAGGAHAVRLERGPDKPEPGSKTVWVLYQRADVTDDEDTTYTYRFNEARRFDEAEDAPGEPPEDALAAAQALADQE